MDTVLAKPTIECGRGRILVVDDDRDFAEGLVDLLELRGYQSVTAHDAEQACDVIRRFDAQVALLDIRLGHGSGVALIRELGRIRPGVLCVMITGYADLDTAIGALQQGAYDYLRKPLDEQALFASLDRSFEKLRLEQENRALLEQLHQAQKMEAVGEFAGGVAHDFNNLLTVILGSVAAARARLPADHRAADMLRTIEQAADNAAGVTRSLLTFSRKMPTEKKSVDLGEVVRQSSRLLLHMLPASIELTVETADQPLWAEADPTQLQQVLLNLAVNARDAMPDGGTLRISASPAGRADLPERARDSHSQAPFVCIRVSDTGSGMSPEVQSRIFEPFFSTKPRGQGTGLGLAIVHGIVQRHDGHIAVKSKLGAGTTFSIVLPCTEPERARIAPAVAEGAATGRGELILLAEDHQYVREVVAASLLSLGYQVLQVGDGMAVLEHYRKRRDDLRLLILDVDLPKRSGVDCLRDIRADGFAAPAIIVTGGVEDDPEALPGMNAVLLRKPFQMSELGRLVRDLLASCLLPLASCLLPLLTDSPGSV